ncbi:hypothetical protein FNF28_05507 [Cafeteria roenbergensis]|uniref:Uncharacterized protein n=1 Tax=Cafeteria roenbergensis TaxID=33653 RepID=A0A5A8D8S5_CAFRO|nr:hypothetical protein FNF28_05507 [Cafeteria roenbergensis]
MEARGVDDLADLARTRPSKIPDLGAALEAHLARDLRRERFGFIEISVTAACAIIAQSAPRAAAAGPQAAGADSTVLEVFDIHARRIIERLLACPEPRIRAAAAAACGRLLLALPPELDRRRASRALLTLVTAALPSETVAFAAPPVLPALAGSPWLSSAIVPHAAPGGAARDAVALRLRLLACARMLLGSAGASALREGGAAVLSFAVRTLFRAVTPSGEATPGPAQMADPVTQAHFPHARLLRAAVGARGDPRTTATDSALSRLWLAAMAPAMSASLAAGGRLPPDPASVLLAAACIRSVALSADATVGEEVASALLGAGTKAGDWSNPAASLLLLRLFDPSSGPAAECDEGLAWAVEAAVGSTEALASSLPEDERSCWRRAGNRIGAYAAELCASLIRCATAQSQREGETSGVAAATKACLASLMWRSPTPDDAARLQLRLLDETQRLLDDHLVSVAAHSGGSFVADGDSEDDDNDEPASGSTNSASDAASDGAGSLGSEPDLAVPAGDDSSRLESESEQPPTAEGRREPQAPEQESVTVEVTRLRFFDAIASILESPALAASADGAGRNGGTGGAQGEGAEAGEEAAVWATSAAARAARASVAGDAAVLTSDDIDAAVADEAAAKGVVDTARRLAIEGGGGSRPARSSLSSSRSSSAEEDLLSQALAGLPAAPRDGAARQRRPLELPAREALARHTFLGVSADNATLAAIGGGLAMSQRSAVAV